MTYDLLSVGETMAMLVPEPVGPLSNAARLRLDIAGAESNVATSLAALGLRCAFVGRVGADPFGEAVVARLTARGVDCHVNIVSGHQTGVFFKDPDPAGTRVYYYRKGSAASTMDDGVLPPARLVHLTGITPALSAGGARLVRRIFAGRRTGRISFDVNFRPGLWPAAEAGPVLRELASKADVVFVGRDEAAVLWHTDTVDDVRAVLADPPLLVVKDGAVEAVSFGPEGRVAVPALPVQVVEPVGAGDAFAAGYLFGLLGAHPEPIRLSLGHMAAAVALASSTDTGRLPDPDTLLTAAHRHLGISYAKP